MDKDFKKLAEDYKKECDRCGKKYYESDESSETVCLQCGKKISGLYARFCWGCIDANVKKHEEEFLASLNDGQKSLFERYKAWKDVRTSLIILD